MLLNDAFEIHFIAMSVPGPVWVDDGDWSLRTDSQTIRLRAKDGALGIDEFEFLQPALEELPGPLLSAGRRAIAADAEKDMSLVVAQMQLFRDAFEAVGRGIFF